MQPHIFWEKLKSRTDRLFTRHNWNILRELIHANFKVDDHNSVLGVLWSLIGPIALSIVMYFVFRTRFGQEVYVYPLYILVGVASVSFFVTATTYMIKVFLTNREFILNSMILRESIIISRLFIHTYKFIIELILCLLVSICCGVFKLKLLLLILPLLLAYIALVLGVSLILALLFCFARDIEHIWMLTSRLLFFVTPIFYTLNSLSLWARKIIYFANPLTPFLISFRGVFMGSINIPTYIYSLVWGGAFFVLGYGAFIIFENVAAERA